MQDVLKDVDVRMNAAIDALSREFATVRTGRASTALLDAIRVDYYGTPASRAPRRRRRPATRGPPRAARRGAAAAPGAAPVRVACAAPAPPNQRAAAPPPPGRLLVGGRSA